MAGEPYEQRYQAEISTACPRFIERTGCVEEGFLCLIKDQFKRLERRPRRVFLGLDWHYLLLVGLTILVSLGHLGPSFPSPL